MSMVFIQNSMYDRCRRVCLQILYAPHRCCRLGVHGRRNRISRICSEISVSSHTADYLLTVQCHWTGNFLTLILDNVSVYCFIVASQLWFLMSDFLFSGHPTLVEQALSFTHELSLFLSFLSIHHAEQPCSQMYFGGSAVGKGSTIGIEISPTPPLIFTGGSKSAKFGVVFNITQL